MTVHFRQVPADQKVQNAEMCRDIDKVAADSTRRRESSKAGTTVINLIRQVEFWTKFAMLTKAEMVSKECRFNRSETVHRLCLTLSILVDNGKRW